MSRKLDDLDGALTLYQAAFGAYEFEGGGRYESSLPSCHDYLMRCIAKAKSELERYGLYDEILEVVPLSMSLYEQGLKVAAFDAILDFMKKIDLATGKYAAYRKASDK